MKYLIRSVKYLVYFVIIFVIMVGIIFLLTLRKQPDLTVDQLFKENSTLPIAIFFVCIAAIYPLVGFVKRKLYLNGTFAKYRDTCVTVMNNSGYVLEQETPEIVSFRFSSGVKKLSRMWEDRITFNISDNPVEVEGYRKDVDRLLRTINYRIREEDTTNDNAQL